MSEKKLDYKQVNVSLSGSDKDYFFTMQEKTFVKNDAEMLRVALRFMYHNYEIVETCRRLGLLDEKSLKQFRFDLNQIKKKIAELEKSP